MKNSALFPRLTRSPILGGLPSPIRTAFIDRCTLRRLERRTQVLRQGEPVEGMSLIARGSVEITCVNEDGQSVMIHVAGPGECFGEVEALSRNPAAATCTADAGTVLLVCGGPLLQEMIRSPAFVRGFADVFYGRLLRDNRSKFVDQFYSVEQRLRTHLHRLSADRAEIRKTQADLAGSLGCARQTLNRELRRLRDANVIEMETGRIRVTDRAALLRGGRGGGNGDARGPG